MAATDERSVIGGILDAGWVDGGAARTPISWPNRAFDPPADGPWIRVQISPASAFRLTIGGQKNITRHTGILAIQIFDKVGKGDFTVRNLADEVAKLFRDVVTDGGTDEQMRFFSPSMFDMGVDGSWYQMNCNIPYSRDSLL